MIDTNLPKNTFLTKTYLSKASTKKEIPDIYDSKWFTVCHRCSSTSRENEKEEKYAFCMGVEYKFFLKQRFQYD